MTEFQLGQRVRFSTHLQRRVGNKGTQEPRKLWSTTGRYLTAGEHPGGEGIIIGKRKLANGDRQWEEDFGYIFTPLEYFDAYLIAFDLHRKPVHVLPEHITPVDEPLGEMPTQIDDGANCIPGQADVLLELANP